MRLNTIVAEPAAPPVAPPLVIVHGLFGSARNWGGISRRLAEGSVCGARQVLAVDQRNHGDSPWGESADYPSLAADLAETIEAEVGGPCDVLGHSMGGKASMMLALTRPDLVNRLIVADIAPVTYTGRSYKPLVDAMKAVNLSSIDRRGKAEAALREGVSDRNLRAFLLQSMAVEPQGARWKLNLDALGRHLDDIIAWPDMGDAKYTGRSLFVYGGESNYVTEAHRPAITRMFPSARFVEVKGAGHWLHAEKPEAFVQTIAAWFRGTDGKA